MSQSLRNKQTTKMPSTPQMRKANEKNAKNILKRGNVQKSSKSDDKYPVSPELIVSTNIFQVFSFMFWFLTFSGPFCVRCDWISCLPNHPVSLDVWAIDWLKMQEVCLEKDDSKGLNFLSWLLPYFCTKTVLYCILSCCWSMPGPRSGIFRAQLPRNCYLFGSWVLC